MILARNDLLQTTGEPIRRIRILWISPPQNSVVTIDVDAATALPELGDLQSLVKAVEVAEWQIMEADPYLLIVRDAALKASHKALRDRAWGLIGELATKEPDIFRSQFRGKEVRRIVEQARASGDPAINRTTRRQIYCYLRRYWQRGMVPNALLPDYHNSGAPGKSRNSSDRKRGRPKQFGSAPGANITPEIRQVFRVGFDRLYATARKRTWTLRDAYDKIIADFFCAKHIDPETGRVRHEPKDEVHEAGGLPSFKQFQYWADKDHVRLDVKRKRVGERIYDKDMRGLTGTATAEVFGPGDRYLIDATIADVYLLSRIDRERIIGRPVIYVIIDVFSRMITGIYVGLEGPSWVGAMMALANSNADKVKFCKDFDISIEPHDWPCHFLPEIFLGDRGEMASSMIDTLSNTLKISVETAAPYRCEWKGIVEQRFKILPAKFKPFLPGYVQGDFRARGGSDYRLDALLDLDEFTQVIINCVLFYNNQHEISRYDRDRNVLADSVPAIPVELWEWGRQNRSGAMRSFPQDRVLYCLLPRDTAMVTELGIRFKSAYYTCALAMEQRWFDKARQEKRWQIEVAYDPRCLDYIYLAADDGEQSFHECTMTPRSRALRQVSLPEIEQQYFFDQDQKANREQQSQMARLDVATEIEAVVEKAKQKQPKLRRGSNASRTKDIRANRAAEREIRRDEEAFRPGQPSTDPGQHSGEVVPFPRSVTAEDEPDYSMPSIDEILGDDDDDS
ncbi:MAG TPA: DDE-type integrase/transposase/recombinase [Acidiphilium sp.]|uniref:Mu transposase C-terminal domain-containing protein n=1 Tax=Acidiphilium sp. TaxID=527 RepID=UPI000BDD7D15|nr:Mu transposase C-terminal domain-containing protein [Acidiphilium sp.]OYV55644.1 MAG: hypothetical protein B7Z76_09310 [Acidiphilium sp. 20-67-58]HQT61414.1 DDE-type integrase/transposase/recombinase [Acidiphilium sp.]HQU10155.1 DDE-type integrase/transposase/recombinase [Acidiphilium sp.]